MVGLWLSRIPGRRRSGAGGGAGAGGVALPRGDEPGAQSSAAAGTPQGSALSLGEDADPAASDPTWRFSERFEPFVF